MPEKIIACPKCGYVQPEGSECLRCRVIFARIPHQKPHPPAQTLPDKPKKKTGFFRAMRIAFLLLVLAGLGFNIWLVKWRVAAWDRPLWVVIYPICGDANPETRAYIDSLTPEDFKPVTNFFSAEAERYSLKIKEPFNIVLAPRLDEVPPQIPDQPTPLSMIVWSLKLRFWAWRIDTAQAPVQDIQLFVLYFDKSRTIVDHSYVMQKGYIGVVNAYAEPKMGNKNNIVIAHELLHLAGATDKYNPTNELPVYPEGYADPEARPLYPQSLAEIMAGSIPVSATKSEMPGSLDETVIGPGTAREINWLHVE
ncbi:MAG: hypothetical protein JW832_00090 [Deltaproteobacteria bacterium]|nr:hypothetical protein [Deltaproteobacteria bacterium]